MIDKTSWTMPQGYGHSMETATNFMVIAARIFIGI
jgi:large-conductance mechanosensitive channel